MNTQSGHSRRAYLWSRKAFSRDARLLVGVRGEYKRQHIFTALPHFHCSTSQQCDRTTQPAARQRERELKRKRLCDLEREKDGTKIGGFVLLSIAKVFKRALCCTGYQVSKQR